MTASPPSASGTRVRLADAAHGRVWRVVSIVEEDVTELLAEGLVAGTTVVPESRAPFRGPMILRVGRARVAVAQAVAGRMVVEPAERAAGGAP